MTVRYAVKDDIPLIKSIYSSAREYMRENGNPNQWEDFYPDDEIISYDISQNHCHIVENDGDILGVFVFIKGQEPTYKIINGAWNSDETYGTVHRIASTGKTGGFAAACFNYCLKEIGYIRIDTHKDNKTMMSAIKRYGFSECGIIYVRNGERLAFDFISERR